ncbi:ABC transporter permease subunit [Zavarzinella formosa]|uniref:ABC transporter permease subunit n=1 Tax=Zavarzinella formosa TaxID=360055 RepID=UPI0002F20772|nr:ABC transporter permease subunit [Zavarzinella formosa]
MANVVLLIARREIRDLLRDRRTLMIVLLLPALLYPAFIVVGLGFAASLMDQKTIIGIQGAGQLPKVKFHPEAFVVGGTYIAEADRRLDDPAILTEEGQFRTRYVSRKAGQTVLKVVLLEEPPEEALQARRIDAAIIIPPNVLKDLDEGKQPEIRVLGRDGDETSKLAVKRVEDILGSWSDDVRTVRFARKGLPLDFDQPLKITTPDAGKSSDVKAADELRDVMIKFLPFLLVMWTMAGAVHPAIDLTAGEKERGTMETLLVCPASRQAIVAGKFLAVFAFSYGSSLWNLMWMTAGAVTIGQFLAGPIILLGGLAWAVILAIPLAALFSSLSIGLGAFARSTKEGQYYLLPIMLFTLPLSLYAMTPGVKLTPALSAIPISGLSMILQNLLAVSGEPVSALSWFLGVGSLLACVGIALAWASWQFRRENVLFRGETGLTLKGWWKTIMSRADEEEEAA